MGGAGSGPRKDSVAEKRMFNSYAQYAARTIYNMAQDETQPSNVRLDAAKYICNRVWGMPSQSHDIGIQAEQVESAAALLRKLSAGRERGNGSKEEVVEGCYVNDGLPSGVLT